VDFEPHEDQTSILDGLEQLIGSLDTTPPLHGELTSWSQLLDDTVAEAGFLGIAREEGFTLLDAALIVERLMPVLLPLLARSHSLVSVDTGPAHVAAALGCPTVALFGVADPQRFRPGGVSTPVEVLTGCVDGKADILGIGPAVVLDAWRRLAA